MKKTIYYLLSTFLLFISSVHGASSSSSSSSSGSKEGLVDVRIRSAVSALHSGVQAEAFNHTKRLYAKQPHELKKILSLLGELRNIESSLQQFAVMHVVAMDNVLDMGCVVDSWSQINDIEDAALRDRAIARMKKAKSLQDINNIGNAWDTLDKIENPELKLKFLNKMRRARSTEKMDEIAEKAKVNDKESLNETSDDEKAYSRIR